MEQSRTSDSVDTIKYNLSLIQDKLDLFDTQIKNIVELSEKEFIQIGEKLQNFYSEAKGITRLSTSLTNSMSGEIIGKSITELQDMLKQINHYLTAIETKFESGKNKLEIICQILIEISEKVVYFQYIVKHLRILGISTKIESARLGTDEQGFNTLADNVDNLSVKINDRSYGIKEKTAALFKSACAARSTITSLSGKEHENSIIILANSKKSLDSLVSQFKLSTFEVNKLSTRSEKISNDIGQVVISVQYHDITKQQLEHVKDVFKNLSITSKKNSINNITENEDNELLNLIYNTCKLQDAQLNHSKDDLCLATEKMLDSLSNVGKNVSGIYSELSGLFEKGDQQQSSVLNEIEKNLISVSETLVNNSEVEKSLILSIESVSRTINELSTFVEDIDGIGTEIELIALNASIKSAHTGENGAPMGIIAESIQNLSKEAKEHTTIIIEALSRVTVVSNQLYNELATGAGNNSEKELELMTSNISSLLNLIRTHDTKNKDSLVKIKDNVGQLFKDIEYSANEVKIHLKFKNFVEDLSCELDKILHFDIFNLKDIQKSERLNEIQDKYTMESERNIYNNVVINTRSKSDKINTEITTRIFKNDELGDNVELF